MHIFISTEWQEKANKKAVMPHFLTSDLNANSFNICNLKEPVLANDATTKKWVQDNTLNLIECSAVVKAVGEELFVSTHAANSNINMNGNRITGLGQPREITDACTKHWVEERLAVVEQSLLSKIETILNESVKGLVTAQWVENSIALLEQRLLFTLQPNPVVTIPDVAVKTE